MDDILHLFNEVMNIEPPVRSEEIDRIHRVGPRQDKRPRPILVKFVSHQTRQRVLKAKSRLRQVGQGAARGCEARMGTIFINEDLTSRRSKLFQAARGAKKEGNIIDSWTFNGRIMIKDKKGVSHEMKSFTILKNFKDN